VRPSLLIISGALLATSGCSSPLDGPAQGPVLDTHLQTIIDREMQEVGTWEMDLDRETSTSEVERALEQRMDELEALTPMTNDADLVVDLGVDLNGERQREVDIDLQTAIRAAVLNNLNLQSARLLPAIQREEVIQAEAVFDVVLGAGYTFTRLRTPTQSVEIEERIDVDPSVTNQRTNDAEISLSKQLVSGGDLKLTTDLQRVNRIGSDGVSYSPNPYWNPTLTLDFAQPLLRGFGEKVNLASVAIYRKQEQSAIESLRQQLIDTVADTESAYWNLSLAWRNLAIQLWLVEASIQLRDIVDLRRGYDASLADWAQAVATVEQRKAEVINYQLAVKEASDLLKALINDPEYPLAGERVLAPIDEMVRTPLTMDFRSALLTAVSMRPDVRKSVFEIDIAEINELVADNGRLPKLDFQAQVSSGGMDSDFNDSYSSDEGALGGDFISYILGLAFEYPLGNRAADAAYRESRLQRSSAIIGYRTSIQTAMLDVKNSMREVVANAELIRATRVARLASAESLRALEVEQETLASLTPTFLNLLFTTQANLASARTAEFQSIVDFNTSVVDLYRAMGTILDIHQIGLQEIDEFSDWSSAIRTGPSATQ
jgi:outer membrane protein